MISVMLSQTAVDAGRYLAAVSASVAGAVTGMITEWRYRSDIHKLHAMSDRQLSDIGLTRGRIEEAVRGGASQVATRDPSLRSLFHP
jgi:uncharacterized protein YjiS (DUF1127 family)